MNRWRSFLIAAGVAVVGVSGYFIQTENGTLAPIARERLERGRFARGGPDRASGPTCATTPGACTSGVTNVLKYSEVFSTVGSSSNWTNSQTGGGPNLITVTDNFAVGPDCVTQNAARLQINAQGAAEFSVRAQALPANTFSCGLWVKGNAGTTGVLHLWITSSGLNACATVAFTAEWTRVKQENVTIGVGSFYLGSDPADCGGGATAAVDVLVADAQCNTGATLSGYIPTTSSSAACP